MRSWFSAGLALCIVGPMAVPLEGQTDEIGATQSGWSLVWYDEFEGEAVDPSKWDVEDAALEKNNELQYYTPEDVYAESGYLVLRSQKRRMGTRLYTSGLVETKGRFSQRYGWFEVRAQLPKGQGIWPAHWLLPEGGAWPPEIDIMELLGHEPTKIYMTNHWGTWPDNRQDGQELEGSNFSSGFHIFAVEWTPERLRWFVDGVKRFETTEHIPQVPMRIILNTAVGGDWPGPPDETTRFPQYHRIDYVRVYRRNSE